MKEFPATITSRGRVTIRKEVREELGLSEGDYVMVGVEPFDKDEADGWILG